MRSEADILNALRGINTESVTPGPNGVQQALQDAPVVDGADNLPRARIKSIISDTAARHKYTYEEIMGRSRVSPLVRARQEAVRAVIEAFPHLSYPQLGRIFKRDHSTIIFSAERAGLPARGRLKKQTATVGETATVEGVSE